MTIDELRDVKSRFLGKIKKQGDCWLWSGHVEKNGYGKFYLHGSMRWAHRVSYELFKGSIPNDRELDHLCRVHSCVNPSHLEAVTHKENIDRSPISSCLVLANEMKSKTHCPQGHPYSDENTYTNTIGLYGGKNRHCRICTKKHQSEYRIRKRAGIKARPYFRKSEARNGHS